MKTSTPKPIDYVLPSTKSVCVVLAVGVVIAFAVLAIIAR